MKIIEASEFTDQLKEAFDRLVPQLSSSNPPPTVEKLTEIVESQASKLLVAIDDEADDMIVGTLTLAVFSIPTGVRAWIEDVVVDESARGKGVGAQLSLAALELAKELGCVTVDLTSRPTREAANRLYKRLGFMQRETNVYRFEI